MCFPLQRAKIVTFNQCHFQDVLRKNWSHLCVIVPQTIKLYEMTLLDNICLGAKTTDQGQVKEILKILHFSPDLKKRLAEVIHPDGKGLSGGQRQLIGIARALIGSHNYWSWMKAPVPWIINLNEKFLLILCKNFLS